MIFDHQSTYWLIGSVFILGILTWQDYKNNMMIDDRRNFFMFGLTISLLTHFYHGIWYMLAIIATSTLLHFALQKWKVLGSGDTRSLSWIFLGFGIISLTSLAVWVIIFVLFTTFFHILKFTLFKKKARTPFYGVILLSYLAAALLLLLGS